VGELVISCLTVHRRYDEDAEVPFKNILNRLRIGFSSVTSLHFAKKFREILEAER